MLPMSLLEGSRDRAEEADEGADPGRRMVCHIPVTVPANEARILALIPRGLSGKSPSACGSSAFSIWPAARSSEDDAAAIQLHPRRSLAAARPLAVEARML